jgi:hypothetical protein
LLKEFIIGGTKSIINPSVLAALIFHMKKNRLITNNLNWRFFIFRTSILIFSSFSIQTNRNQRCGMEVDCNWHVHRQKCLPGGAGNIHQRADHLVAQGSSENKSIWLGTSKN